MTDWDLTRVTDDVDDNLAAYHNELIDAIWGFNGPQGFLINGKISVTVVSDDLVVAIKTLAGADPSATDPVGVRIGDTVRLITAALSVTAADATNWCNAGSAALATQEIDYFVYLGYNATDGVVIGFSRIPSARQYSDFSATTTNEKFCKISTITTAASTDYYEVIGRFAATLSAGAGYTWTVPTFTAKNLIQRPIYETRWQNWTIAFTGFSAAPTDNVARYMITRSTVRWYHRSGTSGTSDSTSFIISLPFKISTLTNAVWQGLANCFDNSALLTTACRISMNAGDSAVAIFSNTGAGAWTASGGKRVGGMQITEYEY